MMSSQAATLDVAEMADVTCREILAPSLSLSRILLLKVLVRQNEID